MNKTLQPAAWPRPKGYANGVVARGRTIFVAGMIGWDEQQRFPAADLAGQARQALANVRAVLAEDGATPEHIVRMVWYVTDRAEYLRESRAIGAAYRELIGNFAVAMTAVEVKALMEAQARVEIEVTAVVPD